MASVSELVSAAQGEVGYSRWDDPEEGTKYGRWYARQTGNSYFGASGVPYCDMFVSYVLSCVGVSWLSAYVPGREAQARQRGALLGKDQIQAGDLITFDWDGDGESDHIGIATSGWSGSWINTVEGNTSSGTSGSQSNGGVVAARSRYYGDVAYGIRVCDGQSSGGSSSSSSAAVSSGVVAGTSFPSWPSSWDGTDPWVISTGEGWLTENGEWNLPTALRHCRVMNAEGRHEIFAHANLQRFLNSAIPAESLRSLNGYAPLEVDGIWGADTTRALQYLMWCWVPEVVRVRAANRTWGQFVTGVWDVATCQVYQRMLNMSVSHSAKLMGS